MNLELIQQALENGARIDIKFHKIENEEKAKEIISELAKDLGNEIKTLENEGAHWVTTDGDYSHKVAVTAFFEKEVEKDVGEPFTGSILSTDRAAI